MNPITIAGGVAEVFSVVLAGATTAGPHPSTAERKKGRARIDLTIFKCSEHPRSYKARLIYSPHVRTLVKLGF
jgi:hypothetical protein